MCPRSGHVADTNRNAKRNTNAFGHRNAVAETHNHTVPDGHANSDGEPVADIGASA